MMYFGTGKALNSSWLSFIAFHQYFLTDLPQAVPSTCFSSLPNTPLDIRATGCWGTSEKTGLMNDHFSELDDALNLTQTKITNLCLSSQVAELESCFPLSK